MSDLTKYWDKIKGYVAPVAPMIGTLVAGPAGGTVGTMIASALGVEDKPEAILEHLENNPDAVLKIKELELTHKTRLEELTLEETKAHLADTQNARAAEIERMKAGGDNKFMYYLAAAIVLGFFAVIAGLYFKAIPDSSRDVAYLLLGALTGEFGKVVNYFFGSSKGSSDKTTLLMKGK
jgi:hypothetical protein